MRALVLLVLVAVVGCAPTSAPPPSTPCPCKDPNGTPSSLAHGSVDVAVAR